MARTPSRDTASVVGGPAIALVRFPGGTLVDDLAQQPRLLGAERTPLQEVRSPFQRAPKRLAEPPQAHGAVVARGQGLRHPIAPEQGRARVLGILEEPVGERLVDERARLDGTGKEAEDGVADHERRQLAAGQDEVPDRELEVDHGADALVDALVPRTHQDEVRSRRKVLGTSLPERLPGGVEQDHGGFGPAQRRERGGHRLGPEHHPGAAAVRCIVDAAVTPQAPLPKIVDADGREAFLLDAPRDAGGERSCQHLREQREDLDLEGHVVRPLVRGRPGRGFRTWRFLRYAGNGSVTGELPGAGWTLLTLAGPRRAGRPWRRDLVGGRQVQRLGVGHDLAPSGRQDPHEPARDREVERTPRTARNDEDLCAAGAVDVPYGPELSAFRIDDRAADQLVPVVAAAGQRRHEARVRFEVDRHVGGSRIAGRDLVEPDHPAGRGGPCLGDGERLGGTFRVQARPGREPGARVVREHLHPDPAVDAVEAADKRDDESLPAHGRRAGDQTISSWNCSPSRAPTTLRSVRSALATLPLRPITLPMSSSATRSSMTVAPASWVTTTSTWSG